MTALWKFVYRCEATSVAGFVQQLAVAYVSNRYWFYVTGLIPLSKDPLTVERKLIERYGLNRSKWANARSRGKGESSVHLLRYRYFFVLIATPGEHGFFSMEGNILDIRRHPLCCFGYSIGCYERPEGKWRPSVRIEKRLFDEFDGRFRSDAVRLSVEELIQRFQTLRVEPYAPVKQQCLRLLSRVNRARKAGGLDLVPVTALRLRRMPVQVFKS